MSPRIKRKKVIAFLIPVARMRNQLTRIENYFNAFAKAWFQFNGRPFQFNSREIHLPVRSSFKGWCAIFLFIAIIIPIFIFN